MDEEDESAAGIGMGISPEIQEYFAAVDRNDSGKINAKELQAALVNAQSKNFSEEICSLMIGMFDLNKSGTIDIYEFHLLYTYINQWLTVFRTYDRDVSGYIEETELCSALEQMSFRFSQSFIKFLINKSDLENHKRISVDQFIVICIQIQRLSAAFSEIDNDRNGIVTLAFEEFLSIAINSSF